VVGQLGFERSGKLLLVCGCEWSQSWAIKSSRKRQTERERERKSNNISIEHKCFPCLDGILSLDKTELDRLAERVSPSSWQEFIFPSL